MRSRVRTPSVAVLSRTLWPCLGRRGFLVRPVAGVRSPRLLGHSRLGLTVDGERGRVSPLDQQLLTPALDPPGSAPRTEGSLGGGDHHHDAEGAADGTPAHHVLLSPVGVAVWCEGAAVASPVGWVCPARSVLLCPEPVNGVAPGESPGPRVPHDLRSAVRLGQPLSGLLLALGGQILDLRPRRLTALAVHIGVLLPGPAVTAPALGRIHLLGLRHPGLLWGVLFDLYPGEPGDALSDA